MIISPHNFPLLGFQFDGACNYYLTAVSPSAFLIHVLCGENCYIFTISGFESLTPFENWDIIWMTFYLEARLVQMDANK